MLSSAGRHTAYTQEDNTAGWLIRITGQVRSNDQMQPVLFWDYHRRVVQWGNLRSMELSGFSRVLASRESLFSLHFHFFFFISFSTTKDVEQLPSGNGRMLAISELYFQIYAKPYQKIQRQINFVLKKNSTMIIKDLCPYLKIRFYWLLLFRFLKIMCTLLPITSWLP